MTSAADFVSLLPSDADSTTRDGVTSITLAGGASKSFPTLQLTMSATARGASLPCGVPICVPARERTFHTRCRSAIGWVSPVQTCQTCRRGAARVALTLRAAVLYLKAARWTSPPVAATARNPGARPGRGLRPPNTCSLPPSSTARDSPGGYALRDRRSRDRPATETR